MTETNIQIKESDDWTKVLGALNDFRYHWRTIEGIVNQTGVSEAIIRAELEEHQQEVVKSMRHTEDGKEIYTTREKYKRLATIGQRIKMAIFNRIY